MEFLLTAISVALVLIGWWFYAKLLDEARYGRDYSTLVYLIVCGLLPLSYTAFALYFILYLWELV